MANQEISFAPLVKSNTNVTIFKSVLRLGKRTYCRSDTDFSGFFHFNTLLSAFCFPQKWFRCTPKCKKKTLPFGRVFVRMVG